MQTLFKLVYILVMPTLPLCNLIGSEITLREHPAYGQHVTLYNAQLLGWKALTVYNTCES